MGDLTLALKSNPEIKQKFEDFADLNFVSELYRFTEEVASYKQFYFSRNPKERLRRAVFIVNVFVVVGSMFSQLQSNVDTSSLVFS